MKANIERKKVIEIGKFVKTCKDGNGKKDKKLIKEKKE